MDAQPSVDQLLLVGTLSTAHGVRGQLKLIALTATERLRRVKSVYVGEKAVRYRLLRIAEQKPGHLIVALSGVGTREAADELRGQEMFIAEGDAEPLGEDEYFLHDLPGLRVDTVDGEHIGVVREVIETGANEVLVVTRPAGGDALIPMIRDVVKRLDLVGKVVEIEPIPGLLE